MISYVLVLFSKKIILSLKRRKPFRKNVILEEELDGIGNLEDLPRLVFIDRECGDLKVSVDGGNLTRNINERKSDVLQGYRRLLRDR